MKRNPYETLKGEALAEAKSEFIRKAQAAAEKVRAMGRTPDCILANMSYLRAIQVSQGDYVDGMFIGYDRNAPDDEVSACVLADMKPEPCAVCGRSGPEPPNDREDRLCDWANRVAAMPDDRER